MIKITKIILLFLCIFCISSSQVFSATLFYDNFNDTSLSNWIVGVGDTSWKIDNGRLKGENYFRNESYLYAKNTSNLSDFEFRANVQNDSGLDQHFIFRMNDSKSDYYQFELRYADPFWANDGGTLRLWKFVNNNYSKMNEVPFSLEKNTVYKLRVVCEGRNIKAFINDVLLFDWSDNSNSPLYSGSFALHNYSGDYFSRPVVNYFDNILINNIGDGDLIEEEKNKIVIIPGLGASWNEGAMVFNQIVENSDWKMTPFVNNYNALIQTFESAGLVNDTDFYVWNYDWRKPVSEIVSDFNDFINSIAVSDEKIDIVGHSLGGLVGRIWGQENLTRVGKVISLGSPHGGAVSAYEAWNGAKLTDKYDVAGIGLNVLLQLQSRIDEKPIDTIKNKVKVLKDILPVHDFLLKDGVITQPALNNEYLKSKNALIDIEDDWLNTISGIGKETKEWISLGGRNLIDKIWGLWIDGRPLEYIFGDGDGTVLEKSSKFVDVQNYNIESNHNEIVEKSINNIFTILDLETDYAGGNNNYDLSKKMVFYLGSPAHMELICDNVLVEESNNFIVAGLGNYKYCNLAVIGDEGGKYHLVYGLTDDEKSWGYVENQIESQETQVWNFQIVKNSLKIADNNRLIKSMIRNILRELKGTYRHNRTIDSALGSLENEKWSKLVGEVFRIRKETGERTKTRMILDYLLIIFEDKYSIKNRIDLSIAKESIKLNLKY